MLQNESPEGGNSAPLIRLVPVSSSSLDKTANAALEKAAASSVNLADSSSADAINLDTITGTVTKYFLVQNTGSQNISDVELQTDNPNFTFSPSHISVLPPSSGSVSVQQIIALTITHGAITNDSSKFASTLKPGVNTTLVSISGNPAISPNTPAPVSEQIEMTAYAELIDITAKDDGGTVDLFHPAGQTSSSLSPDLYPTYLATGDSVTLINTGNVPLDVTYWTFPDSASVDAKVAVSDSTRVPVSATVALDGGNVTTDPNKLPVARNGKIYASFLNRSDISLLFGR